ncbi:Thioredoxin-like fold [Senna tora]|uniref:Thioredoxin-like fold n=1 Tax=Senna tora TaxID=362788 RepID=A0A834SNX0_9FABA|nr:Thioredoxin-like fold [Senna tora]
MGCVSSKHLRKDLKREVLITVNGGDYLNHVVSLTSSTYGALNLDMDKDQPLPDCVSESKRSPPREHPEIINAWELMEGLEEDDAAAVPTSNNQPKKSPKSTPFLRNSPFKFGSPKTVKKLAGKENNIKVQVQGRGGIRRLDYSPKGILKPNNNINISVSSPKSCKSRKSSSSQSPLFDPELLATYEKELSQEEEQIKRMVWTTPRRRRSARKSVDLESFLDKFDKMCPPGGEDSVVIYTTTLRGIRKTFEECNRVRSILESHDIHVCERDVSMDAGFKEEVRKLMGTKGVKVPMVFVKGRLIGGADEVVKLEEEEKLGLMFEGIPRARSGCEGCGGVRFVMCVECNGSCKVLDEEHKKTLRCGQCNENGLIQCPICR